LKTTSIALVSAVLLSFPISAESGATPSPAGVAEKAEGTVAPKKKLPPIFDTEIDGFLELQQKQEICYKSNRRLLILLGTNDCDLCRIANAALYDQKIYDVLFKQFVMVNVDVSAGSKNRELLAKLKIDDTKGLPVMAIFDDKGSFVEATQHGEMVTTSKKGVEAVQSWLLSKLIKTDS
jgi:thioredoxin-related protein